MSQGNYHNLSNIAAQGGKQAYRENFAMKRQVPGMAGGDMNMTCPFPSPPPFRTYCGPAQFHSLYSGENYAKLTTAYGYSRPSF